ncbi:MAG: hypothetical protein A2W91_10385 [Bacteroidetes bacterium GWF2_38_335]|nr:MAG: hypothetical protein A2W91_10385 [Bacteroidetes bacterium GWF2_38_335]OFY81889.1 MAG: hypothetical protein A2281_06655 [Bacteroidetes bacterium RIFOXYA12_FULL_38_20]HBS87966.1 hypothetical protein [Bacteroidales bacterium]
MFLFFISFIKKITQIIQWRFTLDHMKKLTILIMLILISSLIFSQDSTSYKLTATKITKGNTTEKQVKIYEIETESYLKIKTQSGDVIRTTNSYKITENAIVFENSNTVKLTDIESITATYKISEGKKSLGEILIVYAPIAIITGVIILITSSLDSLFENESTAKLAVGIFFGSTALPAKIFGNKLSNHQKTFYTNKWKIESVSE